MRARTRIVVVALAVPLLAPALLVGTAQGLAEPDRPPPPPPSTSGLCGALPPDAETFTDIAGNTHESAIACLGWLGIAEGYPG